jgi:hypothetical protein
MSDEMEDDAPTPRRRGGVLSVLLPLATAVVALLVGGGAGALAVGVAWRSSPPTVKEVPRELTEAEISAVCNPFVSDTLAVLTEAQAKVQDLEGQVATKEAEIAKMEEAAKKGGEAGRRMYAQLQAAKAELETLRAQLQQAVLEKEEALVKLEETVKKLEATEADLEVTKEKLGIAEGDVLDNRWRGFGQQAVIDICEKGGRRKMGKCREAVQEAVKPLEGAYRHCVKSGQAVPGMREVTKDMERLPDYSQYLNEEDKILKGWYVTMCDPTLPEAPDFAEALLKVRGEDGLPATPDGALPEAPAAKPGEGGGLDDLLDE